MFTKIKPKTSFREVTDGPPQIDGRYDPAVMKRGEPGITVGKSIYVHPDIAKAITADANFFGNAVFVVKEPGSDVHKFPVGTEELGQVVCDHQYSVSKHATSKACIMLVRSPTLEKGTDLVGNIWHNHAYPKPLMELMKYAALGLGLVQHEQDMRGLTELNSDLIINEYIWANSNGTHIQSAPAEQDLTDHMDMTKSPPSVALKPIKDEWGADVSPDGVVPHHVADARDVSMITTYTYHRAPNEDEIPEEDLGQERIFVDIMYIPTDRMAEFFPKG